jgi:hypothetical protein
MSTDPEILSSPTSRRPAADLAALGPHLLARPRRIPNFGHTVLFFTVAIIVLLLTSVSVFAIVMGLHLLGPETPEQLLREPRLLIPSMAAGYLIAGAIVWAIFTYLWQQPFPQGACTGTFPWCAAAGFAAGRRRCLEPGGPVPVEFPSHSQDTPHRRLLSHSGRRVDGGPLWHLSGAGF